MNRFLLICSAMALLCGECFAMQNTSHDNGEYSRNNNNQKGETVSIDGKDIPIASWIFDPYNLKMIQNDAQNQAFERIDRGQRWQNYDYQCCINSLELTDEENKSIPLHIRNKAHAEKGLFADDDASWKEISKKIQRRIVIYEYQDGFIISFFEYGSEFSNNGMKRICLEGRHYKKLGVKRKEEVASVSMPKPDKQLEQQSELINLQRKKIANYESALQKLQQQLNEEIEKNRQAILREQKLKAQIEELKQLLENSRYEHRNIEEQKKHIEEANSIESDRESTYSEMSFNPEQTINLIKAIKNKNLSKVMQAIENGADVNGQDESLNTPLHRAIASKDLSIIKYLVEYCGANINKENNLGATSFHIAIVLEAEDIIRYLVDHGADINRKRKDGATPLFVATGSENYQIVKYLVEHDININEENNEKSTPLLLAATRGLTGIVTLLVEHGADINIKNKFGETPLSVAKSMLQKYPESKQYQEIINYLENRNTKTNNSSFNEERRKNYAEKIFNDVPNYNLLVAIEKNKDLSEIKFMIPTSSIDKSIDQLGNTTLLKAVQSNNLELVKYLIQQGADINKPNNNDITPLYLASYLGYTKIVQYLVENGANINKGKKRDTPLSIAKRKGYSEIISYLTSKGAV